MQLIVSNDPEEIIASQQNALVFRNEEKREDYISSLPSSPNGYYLFTGEMDCVYDNLHLLFAKKGYVRASLEDAGEKNIFFIWQGRNSPKSIYNVKCHIKNLLIVQPLRENFFSKKALPCTKHISKDIPQTWNWEDFYYKSGVWIVKIDRKGSFGGRDNFIISSLQEWLNTKKLLVALKKSAQRCRKNAHFTFSGAIVSRYILNPLLEQHGKKVHFRRYIMLNSSGKHSISPFVTRYCSASPYVPADFSNKDIHDSHLRSTPSMDVFTEERDARIMQGTREICLRILKEVENVEIKCYEESQHGYHIIAPDILFDANYRPYLLEINTTPGFGDIFKAGMEGYEKLLSKWEFENGILPYL